MIRRTSLAFLGFTFVLNAFGGGREEYTRTFDKTLTLRSNQKVYVQHRYGDITIKTHSEPDVVIHADIKVSGPDTNQAKAFADRVEILVDPGATELVIGDEEHHRAAADDGTPARFTCRHNLCRLPQSLWHYLRPSQPK